MVESAFVQLLQAVAVAANQATSIEEAARICLRQVCEFMDWPVGHLLICGRRSIDPAGYLASTSTWHFDDPERFATFREAIEGMSFGPGEGLPGQVLESRRPLWVSDISADDSFTRAEAAAQAGIRAAFAA